MDHKNGAYAIVTGASSGIGRAIAGELASRKHDLVLHSLPGQGLDDFCTELESVHKIKAYGYEGDLTTRDGPEDFVAFVRKKGLHINILVNNAGIGYEGPIEECTKEQIEVMIHLNIRALTLLTYFFTPDLKTQSKSYLMNISSVGGYIPSAYKSVYLASKSYIYFFTRSLEAELQGSSIGTCVVVPAAVRTNRMVIDRIERNGWFSQKSALYPEEVAAKAVAGMFKGRKVIIPGSFANLFFWFGCILPEGLVIAISKKMFRNYRIEN